MQTTREESLAIHTTVGFAEGAVSQKDFQLHSQPSEASRGKQLAYMPSEIRHTVEIPNSNSVCREARLNQSNQQMSLSAFNNPSAISSVPKPAIN